jgi:hypothetical protein
VVVTPKDVLIFESDAFSLEPSIDERGVASDLPLGDDLAAFLRRELQSMKAPWPIAEPVLEDFGSVLGIDAGNRRFTVTVTWIVGPGNNSWALQFAQSHGCLGMFMKRRTDLKTLDSIKTMASQVVLAHPEKLRNARWLADAEFSGLA